VACPFWLVEYFRTAPGVPYASHAFDRTVAARNDLGLLTEEYNGQENEPPGNSS
jgi:GH15 family glucan-1,4-alpha-glucosidase